MGKIVKVNSGLRFKINLIILITLGITMIIYGIILYPFELHRRATIVEQIKVNLLNLAHQHNDNIANELFARHEKALQNSFDEMLAQQGIIFAGVYTMDGQPYSHSGEKKPLGLLIPDGKPVIQTPFFLEQTWNNSQVLTCTTLLEILGEKIGYLQFHYSLDKVQNQTKLMLIIFIALFFTMLFFIHAMLSHMLSKLVLRPVYTLKNAMQLVSSGNFGSPVDLKTKDEIGQMARTFNQMSKDLEDADAFMKKSNQRLEILVTKRTKELNEKNEKLKRLSQIDGLTGVANRRLMDEYLQKEWLRAIRNNSPFSVILLDIDYFKLYNDNYGHIEGDRCLKKVAQTISTIPKRPFDLVARYGGEEFLIILPDTEDAGKIAEICRSSIEALQISHTFSKISDFITISAGYSTMFPKKGSDPKLIMNLSDKALYAAKEQGRNRVNKI